MTDTITALSITRDGSIQTLTLDAEQILSGLYAAIGCHTVSAVDLTDNLTMWLDEEGLYTAQVNHPASFIAYHFGHRHQMFHGTAVFTGTPDDEGDTQPLTQDQIDWITDFLND